MAYQSLYPFFFPIKVASDGYRRGYVSFAHFLLYLFKKKNFVACIYNGSIFFQIICTFIKLIFVIFASVEIPVREKMGCWNEV